MNDISLAEPARHDGPATLRAFPLFFESRKRPISLFLRNSGRKTASHFCWNFSRSMIATWDERIRFRRDLEQRSKDNPHLIDDIGLTSRQVEAEIAKPFWQV